MALDENSKKLVQNEIENALSHIASSMALARQPDFKELFRIESDGDFAMGWALGTIMQIAQLDIVQRHGRKPTSEENQEITDEIWKRVNDFRGKVKRWK